MKFDVLLENTLVRFVFEFHKNRISYDVIVTSLKFSPKIVHISNSIEHTKFILSTNKQHHNIHLMIKMKVTLTDYEGQS